MFVQVEAAPTATISGGNIVCTGGSIDLTATLLRFIYFCNLEPLRWHLFFKYWNHYNFYTFSFFWYSNGDCNGFSFICISTNQDILELTIGSSIVPTFDGVGPILFGNIIYSSLDKYEWHYWVLVSNRK